jgi:hypothetical protein
MIRVAAHPQQHSNFRGRPQCSGQLQWHRALRKTHIHEFIGMRGESSTPLQIDRHDTMADRLIFFSQTSTYDNTT